MLAHLLFCRGPPRLAPTPALGVHLYLAPTPRGGGHFCPVLPTPRGGGHFCPVLPTPVRGGFFVRFTHPYGGDKGA